MRRRDFTKGIVGSAIAGPLAAHAQQGERARRIGVLMGYPDTDSEGQAGVAAFREGLQRLGWSLGDKVRIDTRWAPPGNTDVLYRFAKELVTLQPDLILSHSTPTTAALLQETRTIPIVFAFVSDPLGSGFVANFPHPGGNVTGFIVMEPGIAGKWLELLKQIAPHVARVAIFRLVMLYQPSIHSITGLKRAVCCPTELIRSTIFNARLFTPIESSRVRILVIFRCKRRASFNSLSTSKQLKLSA
jgi:ABC-type uncharacterized transport system substrate-binding protein